MRVWLLLLALAAMGLAGCADESPPQKGGGEFDDIDVEVDDEHGVIFGVVVDQAIVPVPEAIVELTVNGQLRSQVTDDEGRFVFEKIPAGTYFLKVQKLLYETAQANVVVEAGVRDPPVVKVQVQRLTDVDPYVEPFQFKGFFNCAYNFFVSTTCVNDYTRIDPVGPCSSGGCFPELASLLDTREFIKELSPGWKTMVLETIWEPSLAGTSDELGISVSYSQRVGAGHTWISDSQASPMHIAYHVRANPAEFPSDIPKDGLEDLFVFFAAGEGAVSLQQDFEYFQHDFIHLPSPDGWSFIAGDEVPY